MSERYWDGTGEEPRHSRLSTELAVMETYINHRDKFPSLLEFVEFLIEKLPEKTQLTPETREATLSLIDYKHRLEAQNGSSDDHSSAA